jgi:hypothetical protein
MVLLAWALGACEKESRQTVFLNKQYLSLLPNPTAAQRFANDQGDTLFFYRAALDTSFAPLPMSGSDYERFAESRNAVLVDSTGRYRAEFGLFLTATGNDLYDVTHFLQHYFFDGQNNTELKFLFETTPPQLNEGIFFPELIWGPDTLQNVFATGQPGAGVPFLLYNEIQGFVGFQNIDNQQFYRL